MRGVRGATVLGFHVVISFRQHSRSLQLELYIIHYRDGEECVGVCVGALSATDTLYFFWDSVTVHTSIVWLQMMDICTSDLKHKCRVRHTETRLTEGSSDTRGNDNTVRILILTSINQGKRREAGLLILSTVVFTTNRKRHSPSRMVDCLLVAG